MLRRTRPAHLDQTRIDPWPGFTDIMTGLLLILVFVITIFTITETILSRSLSQKDTELERLQRQVSVKADEIEKLKHEIDRLQELFGAHLKKATGLEEMLKQLQNSWKRPPPKSTKRALCWRNARRRSRRFNKN